jgi:2-C-methyl-D-erythritol 4-phosphate cytidylyltransferase
MSKTYAVVPAAGRGLRMGGDRPKQFLELAGRPILTHTLDMLSDSGLLGGIFLVVPSDFLARTEELVESFCAGSATKFFHRLRTSSSSTADAFPRDTAAPVDERFIADPAGSGAGGMVFISVVAGGAERQDSVYNALRRLPLDCEWVMIHDGVRPFASSRLLKETLETARIDGAAIAAIPSTDTVKRVKGELVLETLPREQIWLVQTPQVFRKEIILRAYDEARMRGWTGTDDASFVERMGIPVAVVRGERSNIKVTTPEDLSWAAWLLADRSSSSSGAKPAKC